MAQPAVFTAWLLSFPTELTKKSVGSLSRCQNQPNNCHIDVTAFTTGRQKKAFIRTYSESKGFIQNIRRNFAIENRSKSPFLPFIRRVINFRNMLRKWFA
ncbi:hypothetical protein EVA_16458 [gut metagenome]|uniref:Uncharacterized protein n=1 Tax=gut metagenome TaxID=749906 RepID=J9C6G7_9ZZZZ